jgi:hypothetical protein
MDERDGRDLTEDLAFATAVISNCVDEKLDLRHR